MSPAYCACRIFGQLRVFFGGKPGRRKGGILRKQLVNHGGVAEGRVLGFRSRGGDAGPAQDQEDRGDNAEKLHVGRALGVCVVVVSGVC